MAESSSSKETETPAAPLDGLNDDVKRWSVVSICLHYFVSPKLRTYVKDELVNLYDAFVKSHHIDKQIYTRNNNLSHLPTISDMPLNYGTINNNKAACNQKSDYDYKVKNAVDFSKLFLQPFLANYTAFDSKCDLSALLGLIITLKSFPGKVKTAALKIRDDVRNKGAHPDFKEWDSTKYTDSFTLMKEMVKTMALDRTVTTTVIGDLNNWEANGISHMSSTPLGLDLYQSACQFIENKAMAVEDKYRILESCYENLKSQFDTLTGEFKTNSQDTELGEIAIEKVEFHHEDFERTVGLKAAVNTTLHQLGADACVPREIYDVIEKGPQAIFFYLPRLTPINYSNYSVKKLRTHVKKRGNIWDDHQSTTVRVCILESTSEGNLTNPDIRVLEALLDSPSCREYIQSTLFIVIGFSHKEEHTKSELLFKLSNEISSSLHLPVNINTVYGRLYPHDHPKIALRMSILFQQQLLEGLKDITDKTMKDIIISEAFIASDEFSQCKTVLSDRDGPLNMSNCSYILEEEVKKYQIGLNTFVLAEFEKKLRLKLGERLIQNLPTHNWADLSRRTNHSTYMLKDDRGNFLFSDFVRCLKNKIESQPDEIISLEIKDCKETHLKDIRRIKDYLTRTLKDIIDNKDQVNGNDGRTLELELILKRFDPIYRLCFIEDRFTIHLTNYIHRLEEIQHTLSLFLTNRNDIEYGELRVVEMKQLMGMLKSGDRVINGLNECSTVSFFLRDLELIHFVTCKHISSQGSECFIDYTNDSMTKRVKVVHQFDVDDFDIAVFCIPDRSIVCMPGIRSEFDMDLSFNSHAFSTDLMLLPSGVTVYKWGSGSGLTHGRFMGASFQGSGKYILVHIQNDPANKFAIPGDSGSLICFKTDLSTVYAAFVLIGYVDDYLQSDISTYYCVRVQDVLSFIACKSPELQPYFSTNAL